MVTSTKLAGLAGKPKKRTRSDGLLGKEYQAKEQFNYAALLSLFIADRVITSDLGDSSARESGERPGVFKTARIPRHFT